MKCTLEMIKLIFLVLFSKEFRNLVKLIVKVFSIKSVTSAIEGLCKNPESSKVVDMVINDESFNKLALAIINQLNISKHDEKLLSDCSS